jgi:hypothetical protein
MFKRISPVPLLPPDRVRWEQIWLERLTTARRILAIAAAHFRGTLERAHEAQWKSDVDGVLALRRARTVEHLAQDNYLKVLKIYTDLVVNGRLPEY